jgi:hypothetical protein
MARPSKEYQAFDRTMKQLLAVPRATLNRRLAEYREQAAKNPNKRGPKPKR